ncbi:rCG57090 [Rattus norvegicus]|uniref:RCG57090 n=1 Tax=Rattus norvegicus TaxID=10116 RepID=A6JCU9_RAT|nr:rCG57090 [Rattus norvegicus]
MLSQTDASSLRLLAISQVDHGDLGIILSSYIRQCHCQNLSLLNYFNVSKSICWSSGYFS